MISVSRFEIITIRHSENSRTGLNFAGDQEGTAASTEWVLCLPLTGEDITLK